MGESRMPRSPQVRSRSHLRAHARAGVRGLLTSDSDQADAHKAQAIQMLQAQPWLLLALYVLCCLFVVYICLPVVVFILCCFLFRIVFYCFVVFCWFVLCCAVVVVVFRLL